MNPIEEHIDKYMSGKLSAADKTAFEAALLNNPELQGLVDNYDTIKEISSGILETELLEEVRTVAITTDEIPTATDSPIQKSKSTVRWWAVAASILVLIAAMVFFVNNSELPDQEIQAINAAYYPKPKNLSAVRSSEVPKLLKDQRSYYFFLNDHVKSRDASLEIIKRSQTEVEMREAQYWLGHAYYNLGEFDLAHSSFSKTDHEDRDCLLLLCDVILKKIPKENLADNCQRN